jgi:sortase A
MSLTMINRGPSHWPGTALPGQVGNMVIAGHRTTYSRPFYDLDLVQPGDEMIIQYEGETFVYHAVRTEIVGDDAMWIADQTYAFTATTFACHPKGSARQRIVVFWQLVDDDGVPVPPLA